MGKVLHLSKYGRWQSETIQKVAKAILSENIMHIIPQQKVQLNAEGNCEQWSNRKDIPDLYTWSSWTVRLTWTFTQDGK